MGVVIESYLKRKGVPAVLSEVYVDFYWSQRKLWTTDVPHTLVELKDVDWILSFPVWYCDPHPVPADLIKDPTLDAEHWRRVMAANLSFPVHVMKWNGRLVILDGIHRLIQAKIRGIPKLLGKILTKEHVFEILPDAEDFESGYLKTAFSCKTVRD